MSDMDATLNDLTMDIYRAQELAKDHGFDSCTMTIIGPDIIGTGRWLDAYMGLFKPEKLDGFITVRQMAEAGVRCLALFGPDGQQIKPHDLKARG